MSDPRRVIIMGDTHGNTRWVLAQLIAMRHLVPDEDPLIVLHCGDFGFWPGSDFPDLVDTAARELKIRVWVTPGNHEDYRGRQGIRAWQATIAEDNNALIALRRGTRWTWHGRTWLSVGGATSPDRFARIEGVNWWPEEELTAHDAEAAAAKGPADVLVTHDVGVDVDMALGSWPRFWPESEFHRAQRHRVLVQSLADDVQPRLWVHGHYHRFLDRDAVLAWGQCRVTSLHMDGEPGNWGILDVATMSWEAFSA